ncbi:MAG TPA: hypothetical protein P5110_05330 [Candidatus Omnitrophota bacterium]|nr:hypothetical protein [Candidatus Omnitrophota bacterium]
MCPSNLLHLLAIPAVFIAVIHSYKRQRDNAGANARILSGLLQAPAEINGFWNINFTLEGLYRNRKVGYAYVLSSHARSPYCSLFIEPRFSAQNQKTPVFQWSYPRPTRNTVLRGGKIHYSREDIVEGFVWGGLAVMDKFEAQKVLEELSQAAEIVEKKQQ